MSPFVLFEWGNDKMSPSKSFTSFDFGLVLSWLEFLSFLRVSTTSFLFEMLQCRIG